MNEIISKRVFEASKELLYREWAEPAHLKNWWGPNGFTNTFYEFDFRADGKWRFTMHGPDGKGYENESEFEMIKENELILLHHISKPEYGAEFRFFADGNSSSLLVWKMVFTEQKAYEALKDIVAEKNEENLDRLEAELEKMKLL